LCLQGAGGFLLRENLAGRDVGNLVQLLDDFSVISGESSAEKAEFEPIRHDETRTSRAVKVRFGVRVLDSFNSRGESLTTAQHGSGLRLLQILR